jgi:hypothetical protein
MSSNLVVEEPRTSDPDKNMGGDELREESSAVESTEDVENRGSVETIMEEKTNVVVTERKVELREESSAVESTEEVEIRGSVETIMEEKMNVVVTERKAEHLGSKLGSETGGPQGDDLLETKDVDSSIVGCVEEGNDPTEISLHDLTGGLDIDGRPTEGDVEEVAMEASVENETDLVPRSTEIAEETKDKLVVSDEQIQVPESSPTGMALDQLKLEGSIVKVAGLAEGVKEDKTTEEAREYTSEIELGEDLEKEKRMVDVDKSGDTLEPQISVEEMKDVINPGEKEIDAYGMVKVLEETEEFPAEAEIVGQPEEMAYDTSNKPNLHEDLTVEENEEVKEAASDSCIVPMDVVPPIDVGIEHGSVEILEQVSKGEQPDNLALHTHVLIDIDGVINSETTEVESMKEAREDNQKLKAEVCADKETSQLGKQLLMCGMTLNKILGMGERGAWGFGNNLCHVPAGM